MYSSYLGIKIIVFFSFLLVNPYSMLRDTEKENSTPEQLMSGVDERTPEFIRTRLKEMYGQWYSDICKKNNIDFTPDRILFQAFKQENEFEVWISSKNHKGFMKLATFSICAADFEPGPKLVEGDGKTPEGFYECSLQYNSSSWFMWMKLNENEIEKQGEVNYGSCFKIFINYPISVDKERTKKIAGNQSTGGAIFIHGNCVSVGCISLKNSDFAKIFMLATFHQNSNPIQIYIYPFRFTNELITSNAKQINSKLTEKNVIEFWKNLQTGYLKFMEEYLALSVQTKDGMYQFK